MRHLVIGIDGGGTKTLGAIFNESGEELMRAEFGFSNFSIDEKVATDNILKTIEALLVKRELHDQVVIIMGISGASKLSNKEQFIRHIESKYQVHAELVTDAMIALHSIDRKDNEHVIMAIGGTGSAVMTLENDQMNLIGGYGYLLGDEGSSYHLVIEALKRVTACFDAGQSFSPLGNALLRHMNVKDRESLISFVYQSRKTELAQLAKVISEMALSSDLEAYELLVNEGKMLAKQVITASNRMTKGKHIKIALRGGFVLNAPFVKDAFENEVNKNIENSRMEEHPNDAVRGAYRLGIKKFSSEVTTW